MRQVARGLSGRVLVGPDVAAELGAWSLALAEAALGDDRWTVTSRARTQDAYLLAHGAAFRLRLDVGAGAWTWRGVHVALGDGRQVVVTGTGAPEDG